MSALPVFQYWAFAGVGNSVGSELRVRSSLIEHRSRQIFLQSESQDKSCGMNNDSKNSPTVAFTKMPMQIEDSYHPFHTVFKSRCLKNPGKVNDSTNRSAQSKDANKTKIIPQNNQVNLNQSKPVRTKGGTHVACLLPPKR